MQCFMGVGGLNTELTYINSSFNLREFPEVPPNFFFNPHFVEAVDIESQ